MALVPGAATAGPKTGVIDQSASRPTGRFQALIGLEQIDDVSLMDQTPVGRSGRGNAATILNLFGEIRALFAGTAEAKVHNFSAAHFSFHKAGGGRCETCRGTGSISIDLQFLPDVAMTCPSASSVSRASPKRSVKR